MAAINIGTVVRDAAVETAHKLVDPMRAALRAAGGSEGAVADVMVHDGHLSELVMRDHASRGDVIVGVDGMSKHADEAEEIEWGGLDRGPAGWVRTSVGRRARDITEMWSNEISRQLDAKVGR